MVETDSGDREHLAVIIHSVEDAQHFVISGAGAGAMLFSTHSSVDVWLRERHGLECLCLSAFCSIDEARTDKDLATALADAVLEALDTAFAHEINSRTGLNQRFFVPLYAYYASYHALAMISFARCLSAMAERHGITRLCLYNRRLDDFFDTTAGMSDLLPALALPAGVGVEIVERRPGSTERGMAGRLALISPRRVAVALTRRFWFASCAVRNWLKGGRVALVHEPLYEFGFLRHGLKRRAVSCWNGSPPLLSAAAPDLHLDLESVSLPPPADTAVGRRLIGDIAADFTRNSRDYLQGALAARDLHRRRGIAVGVWGNPPVDKSASLTFEFLRSAKVPVVGGQHGCLYGEIYEPWQFVSDFSRCDYYLSYGFTEGDLQRIYPDRQARTKVIPVGAARKIRISTGARPIDILFPMTNSMSMFAGGMVRTFPHDLTRRQELLLDFLDGLTGLDVRVKPFPRSSYGTCSVLPRLSAMKHVRVEYDVALCDFLAKHTPRAVIIEYPSQPLVEVVPLDTEIFLLWDRFFSYDAVARELLERRAHCFDTVEELTGAVEAFHRGGLPPKRDDTYCRAYVHRAGAEQAILRIIDGFFVGNGKPHG